MEEVSEKIKAFLDPGYGSGSGYGDGYGDGYGYGYGDGDGDGIKSFCGASVCSIDEVQTIIDHIRGNAAKGRILKEDLTTVPCWIAKQDGKFAHGETLHIAMDALRAKLFEDMPEEERIAAFIQDHPLGVEYACTDLYDWHHRLTGSCDMGRRQFAEEHGIDVEHEKMTVDAFVDLTRNAYGGTVIRRLAEAYGIDE